MRFLVILLLCLAGCRSSQHQPVSVHENVKKVVGANYQISLNQSETFALCVLKSDVSTRYKIVRLLDRKVVADEAFQKGSVNWMEDLKIVVKTVPGIIQQNETRDFTKVIDLSQFLTHEN